MGVLHIKGAEYMAGFVPDGSLAYDDLSTPELLRRLRGLLEIKLHGLCFSAYGPGQSPEEATLLTEADVRARLEPIAPYTRWIRTFSCTQGNEIAARVAHELGIKTLVGAWIGDDEEKNAAEIEAAVALARAGHVDLLAVGNEVLLRGEMSASALIAQLEAVRARVPGVPVGYVDAYYLFAQLPELVAACDFLPLNCYPFWEEVPLERSCGYAQEMVRRVQAVAGDKPVLIAETGWPSEGSAVGAAEPSLRNMALYALNTLAWTDEDELPLFWFSAFDEAWKVGAEGDCGAFWGLWDAMGGLKLGE